MERKRLGLFNKALVCVPNHIVKQWGRDWNYLYPNANVLVPTEDDFKKEKRRRLFAKISTGNWDAVIIGHSQLEKADLRPVVPNPGPAVDFDYRLLTGGPVLLGLNPGKSGQGFLDELQALVKFILANGPVIPLVVHHDSH